MPNYPYSIQLPPVNEQDIPSDGVAGQFLGINGGGQLDWLAVSAGAGDMLKSENLIGLTSYPTARTNLGLGLTDTPTFKNLVISTGSIATSAPVTISQTWNDAAVTFTALKVNATTPGSTSAAGSLLLDLQVGGVAQFNVNKVGVCSSTGGYIVPGILQMSTLASYGYHMAKDYCVTWGGNTTLNGSIEVSLCRDGVGQLALRNSTAAQTFRVYKTYSNAGADYERLSLSHDGVQFAIGSERGGSGVAQPLRIYGPSNANFDFANGVSFRNSTGSTNFLNISSTGNVGIGTTAPASGLHVAGALGANVTTYDSAAALKLTNTTGSSSWLLTSGVIGVLNASFCIRQESTALPALTIASTTNNVGIGTTAPSSKLHVAETWNSNITVTSASGNGTTATVGFASTTVIPVGSTVVITGVVPAGYNGTYVVTASTATSVSYLNATTAAFTANGLLKQQYTALEVDVTDTNSDSSSKLLDLQVGGVSKASVTKSGSFVGGVVGVTNPAALAFPISGSYSVGVYSPASYKIQFAMTDVRAGGSVSAAYTGMQYDMADGVLSWGLLNQDIVLARDSQNTLALRNSTAPQTFNIYNTYQNAGVDFERITFKWSSNLFTIGREFGGTGGARNIRVIGGGSVIGFGEAPSAAVSWTFSGNNLLAGSDNSFDIGASGNFRPRNIYVSSEILCSNKIRTVNELLFGSLTGADVQFYATGSGILRIANGAATDFNRIQIGGTADTHPAIARDGAGIKFTGAAAGLTSHIKVPAVAVGSLPLAGTAGVGARAFVNDASSPIFGSAVSGGGAVAVPVYSTGSAWNVG